jgi:hypothetical protein
MSWICGYQLNSLVFGSSTFRISTLCLIARDIGNENIDMLSRVVAPTLLSLDISYKGFDDDNDDVSYDVLEKFLYRCQWLRNLRLGYYDFSIVSSDVIRDGFSRLNQLDLIDCYVDVRLFIENTPIPNLKFFDYSNTVDLASGEIWVVNTAVEKYGDSLTRLNLYCYVSSANLIKIAERCHHLQNLSISFTEDGEELSISAIKATASLPRLKCLMIENGVDLEDGAVSALAKCYELRHLSIGDYITLVDLKKILRGIGRNLVSLDLSDVCVEAIGVIVKDCPDLQYLKLRSYGGNEEDAVESIKLKLKRGLKKLAKLDVNGESVRLGTDWEIDED